MLVRVADVVRPELTFVDGVVAMDGAGPSAGSPVDLGVIVAGRDVYELDAACCTLVGLEPAKLDTLAAAKKLGLWDESSPPMYVGDPIDSLKPLEFILPSTYTRGMREWWISRFVLERIWSGVSVQPVIDASACQRCGMCIEACPVDATQRLGPDGATFIKKELCIQCFCCHEICPHRAISLKESRMVRFARWLSEARTRRRSL
jgi:ferredoxin